MKSDLIVWLIFLPVIWWLAAATACAIRPQADIFEIFERLTEQLRQPFSIRFTEYTVKCILIFTLAYFTGIGIYYSQQKNYRRGEEHGSAKWGDVHQICKKYADKEYTRNLLLTQNFRMSQEVYKHQRNLNVLVVGANVIIGLSPSDFRKEGSHSGLVHFCLISQ